MTTAAPRRSLTPEKIALRAAVRSLYDAQALRVGTGNRTTRKNDDAPEIVLSEADLAYNEEAAKQAERLEKIHLKRVTTLLANFPISDWLLSQRGIAEGMTGFLLSEFDIHRAEYPSQFWAFAGLNVKDGHAPHPVRGEKLDYSARVRAKCIGVIGACFLKNGNIKYRAIYDGRRHRKATTLGPCVLCSGTGSTVRPKMGENGRVSPDAGKAMRCWNCVAPRAPTHPSEAAGPWTPERAPWGRGQGHRHADAVRYMVKQFLADFWRAWRLAEGLPVVGTYHEDKQGHRHHRKDVA